MSGVVANICRVGLAVALLLGALPMPAAASEALAAQPGPDWRDSGLSYSAAYTSDCFDTLRAHTVYATEANGSTVAYNWATKQRTLLANVPFRKCGPRGLLFAAPPNGGILRFSLDEPQGRQVAHLPSHVARDGTLQMYSFTPAGEGAPGRLWYSPDGGLSWQERAAPPGGELRDLAMSSPDARAIYAVVVDRTAAEQDTYAIYYSADTGRSWERRFEGQFSGMRGFGGPRYDLEPVDGGSTPVSTVLLKIDIGYPGSSNSWPLFLSADGARTFQAVGEIRLGTHIQLAHNGRGVVRLQAFAGDYDLAFSPDGGRTWQPRAKPFRQEYGRMPVLYAAEATPSQLFLWAAGSGLWHSPDGGLNWRAIGAPFSGAMAITPYVPVSLVRADDQEDRLYVLDLPQAGKSLTAPVLPSDAPGSTQFAPMGHSLWGAFKAYWDAHGGLAQFGSPRTEPFHEISATNGKIYVVQYFERNRFEYHPENNPPHDVLLGLLGTQLSEPLRREGHGAFNRFEDMRYEGGIYFPQTGHNLRASFLKYWRENGGLAIYGYPISEEFEQVSPTDGKTYIVQYFQRNRFEYHPENRGSKYEVLLGLLGNDLLKEKGW